MRTNILLQTPSLSVIDYRCDATPGDRPFTESHDSFCLSYVRKGSFGYCSEGTDHELVAGSLLVGRAGAEFMCTHSHHDGGDECLAFHFSPGLVDSMGAEQGWNLGSVPPTPDLMMLAELGQAVVAGRSDLG